MPHQGALEQRYPWARIAASADTIVPHRAPFPLARRFAQICTTVVAEAYAGIIDDPLFGPAVCFGLGGIFVEIFKDTVTELAPLSRDDALRMINRLKAAPLLQGARGRPRGDVEALADLLVRLGDFAIAHAGNFRSLDLNPIIVKPVGEGVVAVDIALDLAVEPDTDSDAAKAAE